MPVMDIAEFLTARLGEDEAAAKAAAKVEPEDAETSPWYGHAQWAARYGTVVDAGDGDYAMITDSTVEVCAHVARHDPARVLREVEAKRTILAVHEPCSTVRAIAAVYSDHPDYDPAWRP